MADVRARCDAAARIARTLDVLAQDNEKWMAVYACRVCRRHWAQEYPFSEYHGGGAPCFYVIDATNAYAWLADAAPLAGQFQRAEEDAAFLQNLGEEVGPEGCRATGCTRKRIAQSVFCRRHHFESMRGRPAPSDEV